MDIDDYIECIPAHRTRRVQSLFDLIRTCYPNAELSMKYKMPTFSDGNGWIAVGNQKNTISLYTCSADHLAEFKTKHPQIKTGKGCINFQDKDDIPLDDLKTVIRNAMEYRHQ